MLSVVILYPNLIAPLFNKFTKLKPGELKDKIEELGKKEGFPLNEIYVMDSSKRTSHSNAFFFGFGNKKRIVLCDTLLDSPPEEIVAVLGNFGRTVSARTWPLQTHARAQRLRHRLLPTSRRLLCLWPAQDESSAACRLRVWWERLCSFACAGVDVRMLDGVCDIVHRV